MINNSIQPAMDMKDFGRISLINPKFSESRVNNPNFELSEYHIHCGMNINKQDEYGNTMLHYALKYNNMQLVSLLLDRKCKVNIQNNHGYCPLHFAARCNSVESCRVLLNDRRTDNNCTDSKGQTPIFIAARSGNKEIIELLLSRNVDMRKCDWNRLSVVHAAIMSGDVDSLKLLRKHNAPVHLLDINKQSPCMMACKNGKVEMVQELLAQNSETIILEQQDIYEETCLMHAVGKQSKDIVALLLEKGSDFTIQRNDGETAVHIACSLGNTECAQLLIEHMQGSHFYIKDRNKRTILHQAARSNKPQICRIILEANSKTEVRPSDRIKEELVNVTDVHNRTALHYACLYGRSEVANVLLQYGANPGIIDGDLRTSLICAVMSNNGQIAKAIFDREKKTESDDRLCCKTDRNDFSALHYAAKIGNQEICELLIGKCGTLSNGSFDLCPIHLATQYGHLDCVQLMVSTDREHSDVVDCNGSNCLLLAANYGHSNIFDFLINEGWSPRAINLQGQNILILSAANGNLDILGKALNCDIDINLTDSFRNSALHYACSEDQIDCLELLLSHGIQINTMNRAKETALIVALKNANFSVVDILLGGKRLKEVMNYRNQHNKLIHMEALIQFYPSMTKKILDRCIKNSVNHSVEGGGETTYNFDWLDSGVHDLHSDRYCALRTMAECRNEELLQHPLSKKLLTFKWTRFGRYFYLLDCVFYMIYMICLNYFILSINPPKSSGNSSTDSSTGCVLSDSKTSASRTKITNGRLITAQIIIYVFLGFRVCLEVVKLISKRFRYFLDYQIYIYWLLYICTCLFIHNPQSEPCVNEWQFGAASVFIAWILMIYQLEHIPFARLYSLMMQSVLFSLIKAMIIFGILNLAFTISFKICLGFDESFNDFGKAFVKTIGMTMGELELVSYFYDSQNKLFYEVSIVLFVIFCFVMPIALMNLLVGLAVGDIEAIKKNATIDSLSIRINYCYEVEVKLPKFIQRKLFTRKLVRQRGLTEDRMTTFFKKISHGNIPNSAENNEISHRESIQNNRLSYLEESTREILQTVKIRKEKNKEVKKDGSQILQQYI